MSASIYQYQMIAQDGAILPPSPGEALPTATPGTGEGAAPAASPLGTSFLPIMLGMLVLMIVFSMFSGRKEKKRKKEMLASLKKHDMVQTIGGAIGSIVEVKPDTVTLKVDENSNTRVTYARHAVASVLAESTVAAPVEELPAENETS